MVSSCGLVPSTKTETRCFPTGLPTYPTTTTTRQTKCKTVITWLGLVPRTQQFSGIIDTSRRDGRLQRVLGGGTAASRSTLALWAGLRQCLLVIIHFTQGGEETPRTGLKGPEGGSERGGTLSWLDVCRRLGATTFTHGQSMGQVELDSCRVAGWGSRGPGERSTACTQCGIL